MPSPRIFILNTSSKTHILEGITQRVGASTRKKFTKILFRARQSMRQRAGFTLIEVLIALAIFGFLMVFGVIAGIDTLSRYNFHAETDNAVALLQKARSESINNIGGSAHGVRFDDASYIISFSGAYSPLAYEYKIAKNRTATYTGTTEINFDQLSGRVPACATPCTVTVSDARIPF